MLNMILYELPRVPGTGPGSVPHSHMPTHANAMSDPTSRPDLTSDAIAATLGMAVDDTLLARLRLLATDGPVNLKVTGASMAPLLRSGDRVRVRAHRRYWPGDIVAFRDWDGRLVIHRLLGYRWRAGDIELIARGDASPRADVPIPLARVIGRLQTGRKETVTAIPLHHRLHALFGFAGLVVKRLLRTSS